MLAQRHDDCRACSACSQQTGRVRYVACCLVTWHSHLCNDVDNSNEWFDRTNLRPRQPEQAQECAWQCHSVLRRPHASSSAQALAHTTPAAPLPQHPPPATSSTINNAHVHCHAVKSTFTAAHHDTHFGCSKHIDLSQMVLLFAVQFCSCWESYNYPDMTRANKA